ncbi:MAG: FKBP-type peptidyl-prolyl cis-trans isomerase [Gemmatimonadota bacterium]|nr:FKBP-type peptidyl-prolyl cis-trans isomerase [Gemmatimonadota bacterium]HEU4990200.1 FKBP-type peptidyl-prolyl cis-trans isomerase [Gemmatimonadaceae bacterium]
MKRLLLFAAVLSVIGCTGEIAGLGPPSDPANETFASSLGVNLAAMTKTPDGLYYRDLIVGTGPVLSRDTTVTVSYSGYLTDGTLFDSSPGTQMATATTVKGFREGLIGMRVHGKRQLVVPSALGYGAAGSPPTIPRQATLVFTVTLLSIDSI